MAQAGGYREELEVENNKTDPNSHASRLIKQELERLNKGEDEFPQKKGYWAPIFDLHNEKPQKVSIKIRLPVKEFPRYNFVGKLLGPKGQTLKSLQDQTGCKMAIMGRGSVRDKDKEEELRKEGGKYAHLEEDLHILVEVYAELSDAYHRITGAFEELRKFVVPQMQDEFYEGDVGMNGSGRGRGAYRGGPPAERGGRGASFRGGRGAGPPPPPPVRGGRGGPPSRGAPRGAGRGAPPPLRGSGRGAAPSGSYDGYGSQGYSSGGYDSGYDGYGGGQNYSSGNDSQYYDYGHASGQAAGYDSYSGYDYGDNWGSGGGKAATPTGRGSSRGQARNHPYQRSSGGGY